MHNEQGRSIIRDTNTADESKNQVKQRQHIDDAPQKTKFTTPRRPLSNGVVNHACLLRSAREAWLWEGG
ncbi:hypothetical protein SKAU_G00282540 [Synaphobranchus kaupii]|uniref:Uncharacterized protein n=1 Tax=Synaphobranchus kaupii TaxID=118154 RepID=A0A9Q1IP56_SYNKA|nr:hypothetical protein SKAU_G00282540 [Synaphobranchus kaupii]